MAGCGEEKELDLQEEKEVEWIYKNSLKFAEGFGHQVIVIKDRKVIFRVKGDKLTTILAIAGIPAPEEVQQRDIEKALRMVKNRFGEPELIRFHVFGNDETMAALHFKNGLVLYVFGFTCMAGI